MKFFKWLVLLVLIALVAGGVYLFVNSAALIKRAIESEGPKYIGAPVQVDRVVLRADEGRAEVRGLEVGQPQGYGAGFALRSELVRAVINIQETTDTVVVLDELVVDAAVVNAIVRSQDESNLHQLDANLTRALERLDSAAGASSASSPELLYIVGRLSLTNMTANVTNDVLGEFAFELPDVVLRNVGRAEGGVTAATIADQIISPITRQLTREVLNRGLGIDEIKAEIEDRIREKGDELVDKLFRGLNRSRD